MQSNLLQSPLWEQYIKLEGESVFHIDGDGYEALAILKSTPVGKYLFCPYGPTTKGKDELHSLQQALNGLKSLAHEHGAFFIRIEPTASFTPEQMIQLGLTKSHDIEPAHSWAIDLTQPEKIILDDIEKTKVRHWRNHQKKGVSIHTTIDPEEISVLSTLLEDVGQRDHFTPQDANHLKNQLKSGFATLYIAEFENQPIAASLIYDFEGTRYYAHAATDYTHRKLMAGTILLVQMILDAKKSGSTVFDFWGITTSDDPTHPWYGFTQYKKSFGGYQVDHAGTWDLPLKKAKYHAYQLLRQANRTKRRQTLKPSKTSK